MWQHCGKSGFPAVGTLAIGVLVMALTSVIPESDAQAQFLKQGARPSSGDRIKTLRPPRPGTRDRIKAPGERQATAPTVRSRRQNHAWFWQEHAPKAAPNSAKWESALVSIRARRAAGQGVFDAESLVSIRQSYGAAIASVAARHNLSEPLLLAVIAVESRGQLRAVSPKGAQGLMQLIPATARRFGVTNAFDAAQNIGGGGAYLDWLLTEFRGDPLLALAGYNAGEGAVRRHGGVPPFAETRDYVVKVLDAIAAISPLCTDPLVSPRSRCDWRTDS